MRTGDMQSPCGELGRKTLLQLLLVLLCFCHSESKTLGHQTRTGNKQLDVSAAIPNTTLALDSQGQNRDKETDFQETFVTSDQVNRVISTQRNIPSRDPAGLAKDALDASNGRRTRRTTPLHPDSSSTHNRLPETRHTSSPKWSRVHANYMMQIFQCFSNSSCTHPRATMVRSFPNTHDTGLFKSNQTKFSLREQRSGYHLVPTNRLVLHVFSSFFSCFSKICCCWDPYVQNLQVPLHG